MMRGTQMLRTCLGILVTLFWSTVATAQVGNSMDAHWGKMKGYATATPAGHYAGQTQNVFTLGSFSYRQEQKSYQLGSIQLPKIKSGCGGIDVFKGGFSLISGDELVAMMRSILQNATTYAFKLAIDTVSPLIGKNMGELNDLIQKINGFNINSCETAMGAVDNLVSNVTQGVQVDCQNMGAQQGLFSNSLTARIKCNSEANKIARSKNPDEKAAAVVNRNYAWDATAKHSIYGSNTEMREFLMSLSGTAILSLTAGGGDGDNMSISYIPPISLDDGVIEKLMSGGDLEIHKCGPTTPEGECLTVAQLGGTVTIPASNGFRTRVEDMLSSIYAKVSGSDSTALTEAEKTFIEETTLPIYRAIDVYSQAVPGSGQQSILSYADLIAYDMVLKYLLDQHQEILAGGNTITGGEGQTLGEWRTGVRDNVDTLLEMRSETSQRFASVIMFIEHISGMEAGVAARLIQVTQDNAGSYASGSR